MENLSDFFPKNIQKEFSERIIKIGTIIRTKVEDTKPPKYKYFIIIGQTEDCLSLASIYINSEINLKVNFCIELVNLHKPILCSMYKFLDKDSFVDCSKLIHRDKIEIETAIKNDPNIVKGELNEEDLNLYRNTIINAETIKGKIKKKYGFYSN
jgi:hypothetical protein